MIKQYENQGRLPRIAKLKLGEVIPTKDGKSTKPKSIDYFRLDESTAQSPSIVDQFYKNYGDKPKELNIIFPFNSIKWIIDDYFKRYSFKKLLCKGDGESCSKFDEKSENMIDSDCLGPDCPYVSNKQCKRIGTLRFMLPEISSIGYFQIDTSSYNSIVNIRGVLKSMLELSANKNLAGRLFKLSVTMQSVTAKSTGDKYIVPILSLGLNETLTDILSNAEKPKLQPAEKEKILIEEHEKTDSLEEFYELPNKELEDKEDASIFDDSTITKEQSLELSKIDRMIFESKTLDELKLASNAFSELKFTVPEKFKLEIGKNYKEKKTSLLK